MIVRFLGGPRDGETVTTKADDLRRIHVRIFGQPDVAIYDVDAEDPSLFRFAELRPT